MSLAVNELKTFSSAKENDFYRIRVECNFVFQGSEVVSYIFLRVLKRIQQYDRTIEKRATYSCFNRAEN